VKKYVLDTNLYIAADRSEEKAEELIQFYSAFLPFTYLHATVVQELLAGAVNVKRGRQIQESYVAPFEARGRLITPGYRTWKRSGEVVAALVQKKELSPGGVPRSFLNDVLLAVSCREAGVTLVTQNDADFRRIQQVERFAFVPPWPVSS
jgi:predicted nucleic acid-binding protein